MHGCVEHQTAAQMDQGKQSHQVAISCKSHGALFGTNL
jgi:hypothetical protein